MKTSEDQNLSAVRGAGYLIGFIITMLLAVSIFILFDNITVSISSSIPIGMTIGIALETKFQKEQKELNPKARAILMGLLLSGIIGFVSIIFLVILH